jgi:glucose/arabinose dehydrogenase
MVNTALISIDLEALSINEEIGEAIIPIARTDNTEGTVSVDYSINSGTATATDDFTATSGTVTFLPGETIKEIAVPILDDSTSEIDETFSIAIGNSIGADLGATRTAIVTILDNDTTELNTLAFSQAEYSFSEQESQATITVNRTGDDNETVSVDYGSKNDYARADSDYTAVSGTLVFEPGETSKTFTIPLLEDSLPELDEALNLTLSNPVGIELGPQKNAKLVVEDNDESPFTFRKEIVVSGLGQSIAFDWTSDGNMFIAERDGIVKVFNNGQLLEEPFIDISAQVNTSTQRGLLGLGVHPEFPENPYIYLAFSYDPPDVEPDLADVGRVTRLVRVTADPDSNYTTAIPGSEVVLLETPPVNNFHAAGAIRFGEDSSLFFTHGDGSPVGSPTSLENAESLQSLDSPLGKMLRIDPITGEGYANNPFYDSNVNSIQSKIYNYGLRNPWRFTLHPETGEPFIGDVGWADWEEIDTGKGVNFGWPLYEGGNGVSLTTKALVDDPLYDDIYERISISEVTAPIYARSHEEAGNSIVVGDFYTGTNYPEFYQGALFFTDYYSSRVNAVLFDEQGNVDSISPVMENDRERGTTQISMGPDSNLYFSDLETGEISRWVFDSSEQFVKISTGENNDRIEGMAYDTDPASNNDLNIKLSNELSSLGIKAQFDNLVGFYEIVDMNGGIDIDGNGVDTLMPGDAGYARTAIANRITDWELREGSLGEPSKNTTIEQFGDVIVAGGKIYAPFVIANAGAIGFEGFVTAEDEETDARFNEAAMSRDDLVAYFAFIGANPDSAVHLKALGDNIFGFEDLPANLGVSDNDFNDAVFRFDFSLV